MVVQAIVNGHLTPESARCQKGLKSIIIIMDLNNVTRDSQNVHLLIIVRFLMFTNLDIHFALNIFKNSLGKNYYLN